MDRPALDARSALGLGVLATALVVSVLGLVGSPLGGGSAADEDTVVKGVRGAVTLEGGRVLAPGDLVPAGSVVRTETSSAVVLETSGRTVEVGPESVLTVVDGSRQDLASGLVLIDSRKGPQLALDTDAAEVRTTSGVARVESGGALRVVSYRGGGVDVQPVGRRAVTPVRALFEVEVPQGGNAKDPSALRLTEGDAWERRPEVAGGVVSADAVLEGLAQQVDVSGVGPQAVSRIPAAVRESYPPLSEALPSLQALGYAVARASEIPGDEAERYFTVRVAKEGGGSWGVVAAIVRAEESSTSAVLDGLLTSPTAPGDPGSPEVPVAPLPSDEDLLGGLVGDLPAPVAPRPRTPVVPRPTTPPTTAPTTPPTTAPTTPPTGPVPEPTVPNLIDSLLDDVVGTLNGLLDPQPQAQAPAPPAPSQPQAKASPSPSPSRTPLIQLGELSLF